MTSTNRANDPLAAESERLRNLPWRKSSRSGGANNDCVEIVFDGDDLLIRDSKEDWDTGKILRVPAADFDAIKRLRHP